VFRSVYLFKVRGLKQKTIAGRRGI